MPTFRVPVTLTGAKPGLPGVNVWHVRTEDTVPVSELDTACDKLRDFYTALAANLAPGVTATIGPDIIDQETHEDESRTARTVVSTAQNAYGNAPPVCQAVISWRTSLRARRGQGRTFFGPVSGNSIDTDGSIEETFRGRLNTAAQIIIDTNNNELTGVNFGVYGLENPASQSQPHPDGTLPKVIRDITSFKIKDQYSVLRSRRD